MSRKIESAPNLYLKRSIFLLPFSFLTEANLYGIIQNINSSRCNPPIQGISTMNPTILIVDDDHALRTALTRWATSQKFVPLLAESAEQALAILETREADVVIVDVMLPGMDGLTLAQDLVRKKPERPVILITAFADLEGARRAIRAGVYEYVAKPFEFEDLGASVQRALKHRRMLLENRQQHSQLEREVVRRTEELMQANVQLQREISERQEAEQALREREAQLRLITDSLPVFVAYVDADQRCRFVNKQYELAFRVTREAMLGHHIRDLLGADTCALTESYVEQALIGREVTFEMPAPYDSHRIVSAIFVPHVEKNRVLGFFSLLIDVTEQKRLSEKIVALERLEALTEMSAGISHNLNNILTGILGPAQLIELQTRHEGVLREARIIQESALRATHLVRRLAQSVGGDDLIPLAVDVAHAIHEAVTSTRPRWKDEAEARGVRIEVAVNLCPVPSVCATPGGLHTVLSHVIFNAVDAMPDGGVLSLSVEPSKDMVRISISDTGIGMDEETRRRVCEPFFTTKAHVGTGLGMSTAYTTISRWGGNIDVESAPGKGTSVKIELPIWQEDNLAMHGLHLDRTGDVLLVEDENLVRSFLYRVLSKRHRVDAVSDGAQALKLATDNAYDVALIDLGMPGMPGDRVARHLRERDPFLGTILVTGWDLPSDDERLRLFDFKLKKPFDTIDKILGVVSQAIQCRDERAETANNKGA